MYSNQEALNLEERKELLEALENEGLLEGEGEWEQGSYPRQKKKKKLLQE